MYHQVNHSARKYSNKLKWKVLKIHTTRSFFCSLSGKWTRAGWSVLDIAMGRYIWDVHHISVIHQQIILFTVKHSTVNYDAESHAICAPLYVISGRGWPEKRNIFQSKISGIYLLHFSPFCSFHYAIPITSLVIFYVLVNTWEIYLLSVIFF